MSTRDETKNHSLLLFAIFLLSLNLRPAVAAIGPLATPILGTTPIGSLGLGLLTTIPVFLMGLGAIYVRQIRALLGETRGVALGGLVIAGSCLLRYWFNGAAGLILTAAGAGIGIAIIQALTPSFAKRNYGAGTGRVIGVYSTGIVVGAAVAAGLAAYLASHLGWQGTLAAWSLPALIATIVWLLASRGARSEGGVDTVASVSASNSPQLWRNPRCWSLVIFFGVGTGAFMLAMAWIPPFYLGLQQPAERAGLLLSILTVVEAATALGVAAFVHHFPDRRGPLIFSLITVAAGFAVLTVSPVALAIPAMVLLGVGIGILFPLSIIVAIDHIDDPTIAGNFTSIVQGGGYIIASFVPLIAGGFRDVFADLTHVWTLMAIGSIVMIAVAARFSPDSYLRFRDALRLQRPPGAARTKPERIRA
ncbi:MFS transporter (plasmid) [Microvirga sp. RSM25]|uniref:MFS transporter n=1 Tax=Microvirga sp. RSM25 TaxID=3273802 RepID=UPI00384B24C9